MSRLFNCAILGCQFLVGITSVVLTAGTSQAGFTTFASFGQDPAAITPTRDAFRTAIGGGTVAGANGSFGGLRREINWDAVPDALADPHLLPVDFFNTTSPRGLVYSTPGTGFLVSANAGQSTPPLFGFPNDLQTFSPQRLFTAVNSNITDVTFFVPGTSIAATTNAFGVIFVDAEIEGETNIQFFDSSNNLIYSHDALISFNQNLSFLGAIADAGEEISRVRITSGANTLASNGVLGNPTSDFVVMDDFLFAEPRALVPEPSAMVLWSIALGLFGIGRARKRIRKASTGRKGPLVRAMQGAVCGAWSRSAIG